MDITYQVNVPHSDTYSHSQTPPVIDQYSRMQQHNQYYRVGSDYQNNMHSNLSYGSHRNIQSNHPSEPQQNTYRNLSHVPQNDAYRKLYIDQNDDSYNKYSIAPHDDRTSNYSVSSQKHGYNNSTIYYQNDKYTNSPTLTIGNHIEFTNPSVDEDMGRRRSPNSARYEKQERLLQNTNYNNTADHERYDHSPSLDMVSGAANTLDENNKNILIANSMEDNSNANYFIIRSPDRIIEMDQEYDSNYKKSPEVNEHYERNTDFAYLHQDSTVNEGYVERREFRSTNGETQIINNYEKKLESGKSNEKLANNKVDENEIMNAGEIAMDKINVVRLDPKSLGDEIYQDTERYKTPVDLRKEIHLDINRNSQREYDLKVERNLLYDSEDSSDSDVKEYSIEEATAKDVRSKIINEMEEEMKRELELQKEYLIRRLSSSKGNPANENAQENDAGVFDNDIPSNKREAKVNSSEKAKNSYTSETTKSESNYIYENEDFKGRNNKEIISMPNEREKELNQLHRVLSNNGLFMGNSDYMIEFVKNVDQREGNQDIRIKIYKEIEEIQTRENELKSERALPNNNNFDIGMKNNIYYVANKKTQKNEKQYRKENYGLVENPEGTDIPLENNKQVNKNLNNRSLKYTERQGKTDNFTRFTTSDDLGDNVVSKLNVKGSKYQNKMNVNSSLTVTGKETSSSRDCLLEHTGTDDTNLLAENSTQDENNRDTFAGKIGFTAFDKGKSRSVGDLNTFLRTNDLNGDNDITTPQEIIENRDNITAISLKDIDKRKFGSRDDLVAFLGTNSNSTELTTENKEKETKIQRIKLPEIFTAASNKELTNTNVKGSKSMAGNKNIKAKITSKEDNVDEQYDQISSQDMNRKKKADENGKVLTKVSQEVTQRKNQDKTTANFAIVTNEEFNIGSEDVISHYSNKVDKQNQYQAASAGIFHNGRNSSKVENSDGLLKIKMQDGNPGYEREENTGYFSGIPQNRMRQPDKNSKSNTQNKSTITRTEENNTDFIFRGINQEDMGETTGRIMVSEEVKRREKYSRANSVPLAHNYIEALQSANFKRRSINDEQVRKYEENQRQRIALDNDKQEKRKSYGNAEDRVRLNSTLTDEIDRIRQINDVANLGMESQQQLQGDMDQMTNNYGKDEHREGYTQDSREIMKDIVTVFDFAKKVKQWENKIAKS